MVASSKTASPARRTGWVLPLVLLLVTFGIPSVRGGAIVAGQDVTGLIQSVLSHPWAEYVPVLLPIAKLALLAVAVIGIVGFGPYSRIVLGYYAAILVVVAIFQNTATLSGGTAVILGNTVAQLIVAVVCVLGFRRAITAAPLRRERLWLTPFMLWAFLYPFAISGGTVVAGGWADVLTNGAGVTYCMITPVIAGTMALRPEAYGRTNRVIVAWLGTIFGLLNMMTWFVINPASWWMGILHIPLMVVAGFLLITSWREPRASHGDQAAVPKLDPATSLPEASPSQ